MKPELLDLRRLLGNPALLLSLGAAILVLILKSGMEAGWWIQFVLGKLAYSTSDGAVLFLLGYAALSAWFLRWNKLRVRWAPTVFLLALAFGYVLNLWMTWRYLDTMQIPPGAHVYHWQEGAYSFTGLFHSHLGKTAFALFSRLSGWAPGGYDRGAVFLVWVPVWAALGIGLAFIVGLAASLMAMPGLSRAQTSAGQVIFVLASALVLRGLIDGGALAPAIPPALAALVWVIGGRRPDGTVRKAYVRGLAGGLALYLALWIGGSNGVPALGSFLFPALFFLWLALGAAAQSRVVLRAGVLALVTVLLALDASVNLLPMIEPLPAGCRVLVSGAARTEIADCSGKTAVEVYREQGEDPRKPKVTQIVSRERNGAYVLPVRLLVIEANRSGASSAPSGFWERLVLEPYSLAGGWQKLRAFAAPAAAPVLVAGSPDVLTRNNFTVAVRLLAGILEQGGLSEFVLLPETQSNAGGSGAVFLVDG